MSSHTVNIRGYEIGGTDKAILFTQLPKERDPHPKGTWIPKSVCEHISRGPQIVGEWRSIEITMPEWLAEKKGLI